MGHAEGVPIIDASTGQDITNQHNISCLSGATLTHALATLGLATSGNKTQQARRLAEAGLTAQQVDEQFGWRARQKNTK